MPKRAYHAPQAGNAAAGRVRSSASKVVRARLHAGIPMRRHTVAKLRALGSQGSGCASWSLDSCVSRADLERMSGGVRVHLVYTRR